MESLNKHTVRHQMPHKTRQTIDAPAAPDITASHAKKQLRITVKFRLPRVVPKFLARGIAVLRAELPHQKRLRARIITVLAAAAIFILEVLTVIQPYITQQSYALGSAGSLLDSTNQTMASELRYDSKQQLYNFNSGYTPPSSSGSAEATGTQISAKAYQDPTKGIVVTDPVNKVDFTLTPEFGLSAGRQSGNRVIYPMAGNAGWAAYTMHSIGVKEDLLLNQSGGDKLTFGYKLGIGDGLSARVEADGSIGVYGNTLLSGNVATGTAKDAALLQKARLNAPKDTMLFSMPAPTIKQQGGQPSGVKATYSLMGDDLQVNVSGLSHARYPLDIDPSIYVVTAQQFMQGNNETNVDFDVADKLIEKGPTTGARFDSWNATKSLNSTTWREGAAASGGYIYTAGGVHPNGGSVSYTTPGADTFSVPAGITSVTVEAWGAGGGGGGGGRNSGSTGGDGGGGGYVQTTLTVTPSTTLNVMVGGSGGGGSGNARSGEGGGGGGYSSVDFSGTKLAIAAGGAGGGGGGETTYAGGNGGAGGGTNGVIGGNGDSAFGGGYGTPTAGGAGGNSSRNDGANGGSLTGGDGADGRNASGSDGGTNNGGAPGAGSGGSRDVNNYYAGGGGGGSGYFGGGGGSSGSSSGVNGGGGGGGSSYTTGTGSTNTAGSGTAEGNAGSSDNPTNAGQGGGGGSSRNNGSTGNNGLVIITYVGSVDALDTVSWAQFNTSTGTIDDANPGSGTCSGWCTNTAYKLPAARSSLSLVAYSGYLYAIGGESSTCTTANGTGDGGVCKTVYISKLGANGEPRLWSPTSSDTSTWTYWYRDTDLSSPRSFTSAVAYNNRMYLLGGKTSSGGVASVTNTAQVADITPTGQIGSWSSSATLPYADYGYGSLAYNDRLYLIGGASSIGGAPLNTVYYITINNNGTLNSWIQTASFTASSGGSGKMSNGGNITTVWGGYIYISGGCSAVNGSGYCTNIDSDTQLASINADGSLDNWNTDAAVVDARMGQNLVAWRNVLYEIGGCNAQSPTTGICSGALDTIECSADESGNCGINQDGDASTVGSSSPSGTAPCSGGTPYSCDMPSAYVGNVLNETAIMNGYLYIMGGCTNNACTAVSSGVAYEAIGSDGTLQQPATCPGGTYSSSYCISPNSLPAGTGAGATAIFNGRIYVVGGFTTKNNINYVTINSDGSLGTWATPVSLTSIGAIGVTYATAYARANPAAASTVPGNLFILGGCTDGTVGCSNYTGNVYKCNLAPTGTPSGCTTSGQLQIGTLPGGCGTGLGAAASAVYANYIYLIGGLTSSCTDLTTARYAKFDNNNNIVTVGTGWVEGSNQTAVGRRRGAGFGYNGYLYVVGGYDGTSGTLADIEFAKIDVSDGSWGPWNVSSVTISGGQGQWGLSVPISNSYAYVVGGCTVGAAPGNCTTRTNQVQTFQVYNNDSGSPAGYSTAAHTFGSAPNRLGLSATVLNGYMYVAGGCTSTTDCTTTTADVSYSAIDANGNLGSWTSTGGLPAGRAWGKLETAGGSLYYIGGQDDTGTAHAQIYYATPSSGAISSWATSSHGLPASLANFGAAVWNNRLYVTGNYNYSGATWDSVHSWDTGDINTRATTVTAVYDRDHTGSSTHVLAPVANGVSSYSASGSLEWTYSGITGGYDVRDIAVGNLEGTGYNDTSVICSGYYAGTGNYLAIVDKDGNQIQLIATPSDDSRCDKVVIDGTDIYVGSTLGVTKYVKSGSTWTEDTTNWHKNLGGDTLDMQMTDAGNGKRLYLTNRASGMVYEYQTNGTLDWSTSVGNYTGDMAIGKTDSSKTGEQIVVAYQGGAKVFDKDGNLSATLTTGTNVRTGVTLYDQDGDGQDEIYLSDMGQDLYAWTRTGTNTYSVKYSLLDYLNSGKYAGLTNYDIEGTGVNDIIAGSTDGYVYIISPDLSTVKKVLNVGHGTIGRYDGNYAMLPNIQFADLTGDGHADMVIPSQTGYVDMYASSAGLSSDVFVSPQLNSGGDITTAWAASSSPIAVPRSGATVIAYANNLYVLGGYDGTNYLSDVQYAQISASDGSVGSWTYTTNLPGPMSQADGFAVDGYMYLIGGRSSPTSCSPSTLVAPISADTTIATGNNPTGIGEWYQTNQRYTGSRYGNAAVYSNGKAYVLGGACGGTLSYASPATQQTTLLTQPQVAKYSIMIDTDTDVYPNFWLLNGVDNSIGARWQLKYRSMTDSTAATVGGGSPGRNCSASTMTTWGQETNFGNVTLGQPGAYTPLDTSGTNTNCARYFYFNVTVDSSQAFGYPDDVTRGPTITDLTLQYTANASKRLMHGRTFTGGLQQPDDTPYYNY